MAERMPVSYTTLTNEKMTAIPIIHAVGDQWELSFGLAFSHSTNRAPRTAISKAYKLNAVKYLWFRGPAIFATVFSRFRPNFPL